MTSSKRLNLWRFVAYFAYGVGEIKRTVRSEILFFGPNYNFMRSVLRALFNVFLWGFGIFLYEHDKNEYLWNENMSRNVDSRRVCDYEKFKCEIETWNITLLRSWSIHPVEVVRGDYRTKSQAQMPGYDVLVTYIVQAFYILIADMQQNILTDGWHHADTLFKIRLNLIFRIAKILE